MSKEIEQKKAEHEIAEESLSNSWKDEYIVVIVFMFIPINFLAPFVSDMTMTQAFENLAKIPEWMQQILFVLVLVVFGMKGTSILGFDITQDRTTYTIIDAGTMIKYDEVFKWAAMVVEFYVGTQAAKRT
jgi:hypothetical protein